MKNKFFLFIIISGFFFSCNSPNESKLTNTDASRDDSLNMKVEGDQVEEINYALTTPNDIIEAFKSAGIKYKGGLTNKPENVKNYLGLKSQSLNLGIYASDFAYCSYFEKQKEIRSILKSTIELSDNLKINNAFKPAEIERIMTNLDIPDSLIKISYEYNIQIYRYLANNKRDEVLILMGTGAFIECLYIIFNLVEQYDPSNPINKILAEQKYTFEVLKDYANQFKTSSQISPIIPDLNEIDTIFSSIKPKEKTKASYDRSSGKSIIKGGSKLEINKEQFEKLKPLVIKLRDKYVSE